MLNEQEKEKIRLEEHYRREVQDALKEKSKPRSFYDRVDGPLKLIQGLSIAVGILFTLLQYMSNSEHERAEAARDFQKTFYEEQMNIYSEAVNSTAVISTAVPQSKEYGDARAKFLELFWGRMSMFEDKCVEAKMVEFRKLLIKFEQNDYSPVLFEDPCNTEQCPYDTVDQVVLKKASLRLAHQCRLYTIRTWLPVMEQQTYNLLDTVSCK